jgi:hypothetical protein
MAIALVAGCAPKEQKVMARFVPERADDFVFENNLIAGRIYGQALEGNPTSPGVDIWVKLPGKLVADEWYAAEQTKPGYYHHDHGGKDCYKVAVSLGGGGSAPYINEKICYPATNYRSYEILSQKPDKISFVLHYPEWEAAEGIRVALDKKITVTADSYFIRVDDSYTFSGTDTLAVVAGIKLHGNAVTDEETKVTEFRDAWTIRDDRIAIWEPASDTSAEPEDSRIGVAVVMPGANQPLARIDLDHLMLCKTLRPGETLTYWFGNCWSKGDIQTSQAWFDLVWNQ